MTDIVLEKIEQAWREVQAQRRTVVCSRADEQRVRAALTRFPTAGLIEVLPSDGLPAGVAYVTKPSAIAQGPMLVQDDEPEVPDVR